MLLGRLGLGIIWPAGVTGNNVLGSYKAELIPILMKPE
jgi:hypothetical protein